MILFIIVYFILCYCNATTSIILELSTYQASVVQENIV